ncbi:FAD-binding domain-containing protein, partial [Amniculicola lignicola CBS 123094]
MLATFVLSLASAALISAQSSVELPSASAAVETVAATPSAVAVPLFSDETEQLTDGVVSSLLDNEDLAEFAHLFAFADTTNAMNSTAARRVRSLNSGCKTAPGDLLWPSSLAWGIFDLLLGGALNTIVPIASVCYPKSDYKNYDAKQCAYITTNWAALNGKVHTDSDSSMMFPLYEGNTCPQGTNTSALGTCTQGGFSSYSVHVTNVAQIQLAVNFARTLNLRLVVKNTGHDYNGRSTGKYALSIWTHNLKEITYTAKYKSSVYSGPVFKLGAGVQGFELLAAANKYGVSAVAGICPTVGVAGGYTAGGGHSPLMQLFGMGADQVLELQVVTADGRFVTATQTSNTDLYWALLGGGGNTFGVVTSIVVKVYPKVPVTTSVFNFTTSATVDATTFWEGVQAFWDEMPTYNAAKTYSYFSIMALGPGAYSFSMSPFFATQMTIAQYNALTKTFFNKLKALNIAYNIETQYFDNFYSAYQASWANSDFAIGGVGAVPGNRIIPTENWASANIRNKTFAAVKNAVDNSLLINIYHQSPVAQSKIVNSVNPAFRVEASMLVAIVLNLDPSPAGLKATNEQLTNTVLGPLRDLTPNGGAYGNEADPAEPNFQKSFWGSNYARLLKIKNSVDPTGLFYSHNGVGSESWVVRDPDIGVPSQNGKLCRV